jgi:UDP-N-acetylglucosamine--N-acetylmuramyl-(pentapeptide) pyrophosphoryl-undecaprenol N-acetylglucosamine transferase
MRVLIAAGGTAGHVSPALALARELADAHGADVRFAGSPHDQEARLVAAAGFSFVPIASAPFVRGVSARNLRGLVVVLRSVGRSRRHVQDADVVVGMGGYASVPVAVAALRARRPLVVHEQNAIPGLANRVFARGARTVAVSFADTVPMLPRRAPTVVTGNPVRPAILAVREDRDRLTKVAHDALGLEPGRRTVVVFGGSQGARRIGRATVDAVGELAGRHDLQLLLLTGPANLEAMREAIPSGTALLVRVLPFLDRMELAYAAADLVVCRAGASSVAEVAVCGLPSVLVPYPYATRRHQDANARALSRAGGAIVVPDDVLGGGLVAARLRDLLGDPVRLAEMGKHAAAWARPDAASALAGVVAEAAR